MESMSPCGIARVVMTMDGDIFPLCDNDCVTRQSGQRKTGNLRVLKKNH